MKFYITGSAGFLGKALVSYLESENQEVIKHNRKQWDAYAIVHSDVIIHLGAYGNHYNQNSASETIQANITDLVEMVSLARRSETLKMFYNISSSSVTLPVQTMYSASKLFGETLINNLKDNRFVNVRPYSIFGEGEASHRFIPTVIRCLKSGEIMKLDTEAKHDWLHVNSFIDLMLKGETNCGSGESYSNLEIVRILEEISGKKLNYETVGSLRSFDTKDWVCPTKNKLKVDLHTGLKLTYDAS